MRKKVERSVTKRGGLVILRSSEAEMEKLEIIRIRCWEKGSRTDQGRVS